MLFARLDLFTLFQNFLSNHCFDRLMSSLFRHLWAVMRAVMTTTGPMLDIQTLAETHAPACSEQFDMISSYRIFFILLGHQKHAKKALQP